MTNGLSGEIGRINLEIYAAKCNSEEACRATPQREHDNGNMLACGKRSLAVVSKDMSARACGDNCEGQLGLGRRREIRTLTRLLWSEQEDLHSDIETLMISSTDSFMAIVDTSGKVWVSGDRIAHGRNVHGSMQLLKMPTRTRIVFVGTGHMHCLALSSDMRVFGAGKNWSGQLGTGDTLYRNELSLIAEGPWHGSTTMIACGSCFSVILSEDGAVRTCGQYTSMCLGVKRATPAVPESGYVCQNILRPTLIDACNSALPNAAQELPPVDFIAAGTQHVLAVAQGTLFSWGQNCCGQLGTGSDSFHDRKQPVMIGGDEVFGSKVRVAAANEHHSLVLTEKRQLWAFGNCEQGRLGLTFSTLTSKFVMSPRMLDPEHFGTGRIACIAAGKGHSAVLTEEGKLYTWGQGRINEWRSPVPSALGHEITKNYQDVPLLVPPR
jgi:alpha-tubulin suppressor-like RCC1 family protein